jgi:sugar O-acyltransferase (sialic acid O-acetyltransferase NeuD family)
MNIPEPLIILGAGGFGRETAYCIDAINAHNPTWDLLGFLDDGLAGTRVEGHRVLGPLEAIDRYPNANVILAVGGPRTSGQRPTILDRLGIEPERFATLIHPSASIPTPKSIGRGSVVLAGCVCTTAISMGEHCRLMPNVVLTHDDVIEDHVTFGSGALVAGGVHIGRAAYIGAGALVREDVHIGAGALVGMGAVVTRDVPEQAVWVGVPARSVHAITVEAGS